MGRTAPHPIRRRFGTKDLARVVPITTRGAELNGSERDAVDVLARSAAAAFALDRSGHVVYWNEGAEKLLGWRAEEVLGRCCYELLSGNDPFGNRYCGHNCPIVSAMTAGTEPAAFFMDVKSRGASRVKVRVRTAALPEPGPRFTALVHLVDRGDDERLEAVLKELHGSMEGETLPPRPEAVTHANPFGPREREIILALSNGYLSLNIAARLNLSRATVRNHIQNILRKLGVHSQVEAVSVAIRHGWI